jgi:predicted enzyme related to lactoylglutathione lyase
MLAAHDIMAFAPTRDFAKAKAFYGDVLGLPLISEDPFALVYDAHGIMLRITKVPEYTPDKFTILGWKVEDIAATLAGLEERGVIFEKYGFPGQDRRGIWTAPGGAQVAWFKDPDGNILSLTQFA